MDGCMHAEDGQLQLQLQELDGRRGERQVCSCLVRRKVGNDDVAWHDMSASPYHAFDMGMRETCMQQPGTGTGSD